jgi:hypothetical protein
VYGLDARIDQILHSDERRIADVAPPPSDQKREALRNNQQVLQQIEPRIPEPLRLSAS